MVFADIVEYSKKPVAEQIKLKDQFNGIISRAIIRTSPNDRIILDTGDGVAISFLGAPEDALFVGLSLRDSLKEIESANELRARIGINLGPVRVVKDINGQPNIIGDGINVAQRVMSFAEPNEVLVSRSFYEVVSHLSQEYELLFSYQGARADKHVREHEVYAVGTPGKDIRPWLGRARVHGEGAAEAVDDKERAALTGDTPAKAKGGAGKKLLYAGVLLVMIAALAFALRGSKPAPETSKPLSATEAKPRKSVPMAEAAKPATLTPAPAPAAAPAGGLIALAIKPWGEIYVDGKKMGVSPPLKELPLTPGKHTIEIKNGAFPTYTETVEVEHNGRVKIVHQFR
ncbi:MAG TPA: adenylate/guanylate cyclase domain-containing protein [Burkholderiales bacterium]|nr:adenylate/guanylate cyclase domain-containing protein [Burkholderiales bacterium]